jgi:hypothetical protein
MKLIIQIIATVLVCFFLQSFFPWWAMAVGACAIGYAVGNKGYVSFFAGFIGVGVLWLGMALYVDQTTQSILTEKVNRLLPLNAFVLTTLVGGLVGGFAALTGALLKSK